MQLHDNAIISIYTGSCTKMDGLDGMSRRWVRCEKGRQKKKVHQRFSKDQEVGRQRSRFTVSQIERNFSAEHFFLFIKFDHPQLTSLTNHATNHQMIIPRGTRLSNNLVFFSSLRRGQRSDLLSWQRETAGPKTERPSNQTPPHTEGEETPLASLPAGPSAPRRW